MKNIDIAPQQGSGRKAATEHDDKSPYWRYTRERIMQAAGRLFQKKGHRGTSIQDIADTTGLKKANIYYYFENKAEILFEVSTQPIRGLLKRAIEIEASHVSAQKKLEDLIRAHLEVIILKRTGPRAFEIARRDFPPALFRSYIGIRDEYEAIHRKVIGELISEGVFRSIDPKLASMFNLGFMNSITYWYKGNGGISFDELVREVCIYILSSLKA